jgi:N-methylhydantoinase B
MEVLKNAFVSITEEMSATLYRSAYSTNIKTRKDFSCALFDNELREIAQAFAQPAHLGIIFRMVPLVVSAYGKENLHKGDALMVNDPYSGCAHLNDICLIAPIFDGDKQLGYVANLAHHVDVGGSTPSSLPLSQELYQEGIIIPPVKIMSEGKINEDLFNFFKRNVRAKDEVSGDIRAQIAANRTGTIRFLELLSRYDFEMLSQYIEEILNYTERRTLNEFRKLPHGKYSGEDYLDDDGFTDEPIKIKVKVNIDENGILCDFAGTDLQRRSPMNATLAFTYSAVSFTLKCLISEDIPVNDGFYRSINIKAPEGTVVSAQEPAGVVGGYEVGQRIISALFKSLVSVVPDKIMAATKGNICNVGFGGFDPRKERYYAYMETVGGGFGGRKGKDGMEAVQTGLSNTENAPVEEMEIGYPVRILRYELISGSGGAGQWRGGLGVRRDYEFPYGLTTFSIISDRAKFPPWGILGGKEGVPSKYILNPEKSDARPLKSKGTFDVARGEVVSIQNAGGGGYGDPYLRDPEKVLKDIELGKVSAEQARRDYGVFIKKDGTIDREKTAQLRRKKRQVQGEARI